MNDQSFEFASDQNILLKTLARRMKGVAICLLIIGGVELLAGLQVLIQGGPFIASIGTGVIFLIMGVWTFKAAKAFETITATSGHDIDHLMAALGSLKSLYALQFWLYLFLLVLGLVGIALQGRF